MKKLFTLFATAFAVFLAVASPAQTSTNGSPSVNPAQFFQTAADYATVQNTNLSWVGVHGTADTGYRQDPQAGISSQLSLRYNVATRVEAGTDLTFSGVGQPVNQAQVVVGYDLYQTNDVRVVAGLGCGYNWVNSHGVVEPGVRVLKKMTAATYAGLGVSLPEYIGRKAVANRSPSFQVFTGFSF